MWVTRNGRDSWDALTEPMKRDLIHRFECGMNEAQAHFWKAVQVARESGRGLVLGER